MFKVKTIQETSAIIAEQFGEARLPHEIVALGQANGSVLASNIISSEFIPGYNRSTVDGYAALSRDLVGCSDSIPAILRKTGESLMGKPNLDLLESGECIYVPTGGAVPEGADTMVMLEYVDDLGGGEFAFYKPTPPGANMILKGEDLKPGDQVLQAGKVLIPADIGTLAAMGITQLPVSTAPRVGVISTGDEVVDPSETVLPGQIRDVNTSLLMALAGESGCLVFTAGIVKDDPVLLEEAISGLLEQVDVLLVSGGTSVGEKDSLPIVLEKLGQVFVHGVAVKPGKPMIVGEIDDKPVFGLPGNPVAAYFVFRLFVKPLLRSYMGASVQPIMINAVLDRAVSSNHGREEFVLLTLRDGIASPLPSKSGLISTVSRADGFTIVPRDQEGLPKGAEVLVTLL